MVEEKLIWGADENLATLRGKLSNLNMDSRQNGGIHLWISGDRDVLSINDDSSYSMSVYLSKKQALLLAREIIYRVGKNVKRKFDQMIDNINQELE